MVNEKRIKELLKYRERLDSDMPWFDSGYLNPMMEALGDDEEDIKDFIRSCDGEDLEYMTELFEYIYGKFLNDDMYDFLGEMEVKAGLHD